MLDAKLKSQLATYLENLTSQVELRIAVDEQHQAKKSAEINNLANEIADLSPLVSVVKQSKSEIRKPSMEVVSVENNTSITFAGVPMGHEFTSLILALLNSGGHPVKISEQQVAEIKALSGSYQFETYVSLSCQTCPGVVQALNVMSVINPNITNTMIDGSLFQEEVSERNIMSVPSVYLNGELFTQGAVTIEKILSKIDPQAHVKQAQSLNDKAPYDMLIVGGGPAGAAAAIYAARKGIRTGIVAEKFGGQVTDTMAIENFISVKATDGPKLVSGLEQHVKDYDVDIMANNKALKLSKDGLITIELENGALLSSKTVMLATGARWREMNVPGEQQYRGKGVAYCPHCDGPLFKGKRVAVIGGGNSGIEAALDLANIVEHVTVLEFDSKLRADEVLQRKAKAAKNIDIVLNAMTTEVLGDGKRVTGLTYQDRVSQAVKQIELAGIFVQIGLVPNTEWLKGDVALTARGEIEVGQRGETSIEGVFAAGDVTTSPYKQIIIAMGDGANAALGAFDYLLRAPSEESAPSVVRTVDEQAA
ncbi:alkyl hydroperoxide reductase subunit F [Paraglaciecola sp. L1A13]|uniref:alkyl hydroperoxide reductase subunit F n=1 Tax=Paraglaciecola sp. L1A13 TaxID=2686359 RepID=UPI00131C8C83|nr:alkyl hydroperoxide reductase subunit F [Paraglaciecola sp. L1A13]